MPISAIEAILDSLGIIVVGIGLVVPTIDYGLKIKVSRYASLAATLVAMVLSAGLLYLTLKSGTRSHLQRRTQNRQLRRLPFPNR